MGRGAWAPLSPRGLGTVVCPDPLWPSWAGRPIYLRTANRPAQGRQAALPFYPPGTALRSRNSVRASIGNKPYSTSMSTECANMRVSTNARAQANRPALGRQAAPRSSSRRSPPCRLSTVSGTQGLTLGAGWAAIALPQQTACNPYACPCRPTARPTAVTRRSAPTHRGRPQGRQTRCVSAP